MMKIYLTEFAEKQTEIGKDLKSHTSELLETLIKIYLYPNHESTNHWKKEVYSFIHRVPLMKKPRKHVYPSNKFIYNNTWKIWGDTCPAKVKVIEKDYGPSIFNSTSLNNFYNIIEAYCEEYFNWLSNTLSQDGAVSRQEVYNKIDELLTKYR